MRTEIATFAAGCFWGVEAAFRQLPGVLDAVCGYTGGHTHNPTYREVSYGRTGHAEAVQVAFDPAKITYEQLLQAFWNLHDPTQSFREGRDIGTQYRSAIFTHGPKQNAAAKASRDALQSKLNRRIATEVVTAQKFWAAEDHHQRYYERHGVSCDIAS